MTSADVTVARPSATTLPRKRTRPGEVAVQAVLFVAAATSVLTTLGIVLSLLLPALEFFREVSPVDFFTGTTWAPLFLDAHFGVAPLVVGTLMISFWSSLVAFPLALGADKRQVSTRIVVPAAISGIIAAFVLGFSRAVGETMIVLIAAGQLAQITFDPRETIETMTAFIGATGNGDVPTGSIEYKTIFAVGLTLFVMTLVMNLVSIRLVRKFREVYE